MEAINTKEEISAITGAKENVGSGQNAYTKLNHVHGSPTVLTKHVEFQKTFVVRILIIQKFLNDLMIAVSLIKDLTPQVTRMI